MNVEQTDVRVRAPDKPARRRSRLDDLLSKGVILGLVDIAIGVLAYGAAWWTRVNLGLPLTTDLLPQEQWLMVAHPWHVLVVSQLFFPYLAGLDDSLRQVRRRELAAMSLIACFMQVGLVTSSLFLTDQRFPRTVVLLFGVFNFAGLLTWRAYLRWRARGQARRILLVGRRLVHASPLFREIGLSPGAEVVGLLLGFPEQDDLTDCPYPVLGKIDEIEEIVRRHRVDEIVLCSAPSWRDRVLNAICRLQDSSPVRVGILPSAYDMVIGKLRHINVHDTPLIEVKENPNEPFERFVKRGFDVVAACSLLVLLAPALILAGLAVKVLSSGELLYSQERVGQGGKLFRLIKFRTMIPDAEKMSGATLAVENDPRVTPVGRILRRLRLDELPQLWNILLGDMSFVGPRPERPQFVADFERTVAGYAERHKVKPGLTGLAQVRGDYHTRPESKVKYDLAYIYNYSLSLDLIILLETLKVVVSRKGS